MNAKWPTAVKVLAAENVDQSDWPEDKFNLDPHSCLNFGLYGIRISQEERLPTIKGIHVCLGLDSYPQPSCGWRPYFIHSGSS